MRKIRIGQIGTSHEYRHLRNVEVGLAVELSDGVSYSRYGILHLIPLLHLPNKF